MAWWWRAENIFDFSGEFCARSSQIQSWQRQNIIKDVCHLISFSLFIFLLLKLTTHLKHLLDGSVLKDFSFLKKKKKKCFHFLHALFRRANTIATTHRKCQLSLPHRFGRLGFVCSLTPPPPPPLFIVGGCTSFHKCAACSVVPTQLPLSPPPLY